MPAETGTNLDQEFQTDGMSFWDSVGEFFSQVGFWAGLGMVGAAAVATLAPDPVVSKVAAALLWTSILAGTTGASINMIQRHVECMSTGTEDAFDTLTIVGNILGARWAIGATVKGLKLAGSRMGTAIVIGRVGTDAAQGILLSVEYLKEYQQILADPDPKHRTDKLMQLLGKAALSGGFLILSMRGSKAELAQLSAQKANLGKLGHSGETIELAAKAGTDTASQPSPANEQQAEPLSHQEPDAKPRNTEPFQGRWQSVDATPDVAPPDWTFKDRNILLADGQRRLITECQDRNGRQGSLIRTYNPKTRTYTMVSATFDPDMERWIQAGIPLIEGKGTPVVTYLMLRQLKMVDVPYGGLKTVKMSTIQNLKAVLQLARLMRQGIPLDTAIKETHSVQYAETTIVQSGHRIAEVRVDTSHAWLDPAEVMLNHYETRDPTAIKRHEKLLSQYGLERTDEVLWNYDIYFDLEPYSTN